MSARDCRVLDYELIKSRTSIREVLENAGVHVSASGDRNFRVPCPVHRGQDRNMSVDGRRNLFHCFVCGASGSVIDLVAALDGVTTQEAAAKLSYGLGDVSVSRNMSDMRKAIRQVERWRDFAEASTTSVAVPFSLGELPEGYRNLRRKAIDHYGLLRVADRGVFIPHYGLDGRRVGYSIRQIDGRYPKYLNNPGFPKHIPFGLYQNKDEIIRRSFAIVCEGQFDSIALWDRGYMNAVSVLGSSLSEQQAHLLLGVTTKLILLFDGDRAGIKGALKTHRRWHQVFDIDVKILPPGMDPAEYMEACNV
jgi:DNA primase